MGRRPGNANTAERILDEVMRQTARGGTDYVSTKEVAKKLGISEPTIFLHFPTKQDLMNAAFKCAWDRFNANPAYPLASDKTKKVSFDDFKPIIDLKLENKKEIIYLHHYKASGYYQHDFYEATLKNYFDGLDKLVESLFGHLDHQDVTIIEHGFVDTEIAYMAMMIKGDFAADEKIMRVMFQALVGLFYAPLNFLYAQKNAAK
jgi:AcrR family transcriptional regulator